MRSQPSKLCERCGFPCRKRDVCWYCFKRLEHKKQIDADKQIAMFEPLRQLLTGEDAIVDGPNEQDDREEAEKASYETYQIERGH